MYRLVLEKSLVDLVHIHVCMRIRHLFRSGTHYTWVDFQPYASVQTTKIERIVHYKCGKIDSHMSTVCVKQDNMK